MSLATAAQVRLEGNLTDTIKDTQLNNFIATAERNLKSYLTESVYARIVAADDSGFSAYASNFSADVDGWAQNASDANLLVTGNNDSILGRDDVLQVNASVTEIAMRIIRAATVPAGGKVYKMQFDYFAEKDAGVNYLGTEISATERGRDQYGNLVGIRVIEESWQLGNIMNFMGAGSLNLTGYTDPGGPQDQFKTIDTSETIANLALNKSIYISNVSLQFLDDKALLTVAENMWSLGLALKALSIHSAGDGITLNGGSGDDSYTFITHGQAAAMSRRYIVDAKQLVAPFVPSLDNVGDGRNQVLKTGSVDMLAIG